MWMLYYSLTLLLLVGSLAEEAPLHLNSTSIVSSVPQRRLCDQGTADDCPVSVSNNSPKCRDVSGNYEKIVCCHLASMFEFKEGLAALHGPHFAAIKSLRLRSAVFEFELNVSKVDLPPNLEEFSVVASNLSRFTGHLKSSIKCLNLSGNNLVEDLHSLSSLTDLVSLDLSSNNLTRLPALNIAASDFWLDISGPNRLLCSNVQDIMNQMINQSRNLHFSRDYDTYCLVSSTYNWFNTTERVALKQFEALSQLGKDCPQGESFSCHCQVDRLDILPNKPPTYKFKVDCSGQQLVELPKTLPLNTVSLNVSNNNITSIQPLAFDEIYADIREFYADNNRISSISILEGSKFINNFDVITLRYNQIKSIPTYFLSFDIDSRILRLGFNKLDCNCNTAQSTKDWLSANTRHIKDYLDVQCDNAEGSMIFLDINKVCANQHVWTDYIYYIIASEIALLFLLVGKVSYDYWVFKTAGYLPWPASKMPKLPCDWFFES